MSENDDHSNPPKEPDRVPAEIATAAKTLPDAGITGLARRRSNGGGKEKPAARTEQGAPS